MALTDLLVDATLDANVRRLRLSHLPGIGARLFVRHQLDHVFDLEAQVGQRLQVQRAQIAKQRGTGRAAAAGKKQRTDGEKMIQALRKQSRNEELR